MSNPLAAIDRLKAELDRLRPPAPAVLAQVRQKLRIDSNYHSNAIEGNSLTLGETRNLILRGLTARGKPMRDHLDIEGHDAAVKATEEVVRDEQQLTEVFVRNLHQILLKEPYKTDAVTSEGRRVKRTVTVGDYKTVPNNVVTTTGEVRYFTPPEQVKQELSDLLDWYREQEQAKEHPVIVAATFHYRMVRIHPFDDGNGRMARLLMNMILMKHGYTVALIRRKNRDEYIRELEQVDREDDLSQFISFVANSCEYSLEIHLRAARGESIDDLDDDIDREIALFKRSLADASGEILASRDYLETVLHPFYMHVRSKTAAFSDVFGQVRTLLSINLATREGRVARLCEDASAWPSSESRGVAATEVRALTFQTSSHLTAFQGRRNEGVLIEVTNEASPISSLWTFVIGIAGVRKRYEGHDLEELKRTFNDVIRSLIKHLEAKNA